MKKSPKAPKLKKGFAHVHGGNCWEGIQSASTEDVCGLHDEPRGDCDTCPRCPACDNMNLAMSLAAPAPEPKLALVPPPTRVYLPTASKTDHLFACTWPFGKNVPREEVGERTRFGSAFHAVLEKGLRRRVPSYGHTIPQAELAAITGDLAKKWKVDVDELQERVTDSFPVIYNWLDGGNMWGLDFLKAGLQLEIASAFNPTTGEARILKNGAGPDHDYPERQPGEVPGTADVVCVTPCGMKKGNQVPRRLLILDHKSGWNVGADWQPRTPAELGQLRTLACAFAKIHGIDNVIVAFFHARRGAEPIVVADELTPSDLEAHRKALKAAMRNVGSEWMRPGPWCTTCAARKICPTKAPVLAELKRTAGPMTATRIGAIHQILGEYRHLEEDLVSEMRAWIKANGPGVRPDGRSVDLVPRKRSNLSMASIIRAYGPLAGGKLIAKLKADGAIEELENLELRSV